MPNTIFAIILGALALYGIYAGTRGGSRRRTGGWLLVAVSAAMQGFNLLANYSIFVSVLTTIGLLGGYWLARSAATVPPPRPPAAARRTR